MPTATYYALRDTRFTCDPAAANADIERALNSARSAAEDAGSPRILLMGSLQVHRGLIDAVEAAGARVIAEDSACDERELRGAVRDQGTRDELLRALAVQYLDAPASRLRDLPRRLDYLGRLADTRRVQGVIGSYYKFCDLFLVEFPVVKKFFQDKGIPILLLEDEGDAALSGQARTRLEAFVEMLR